MPKIIITGAAGRLGSAVVGQMLRLFPEALVAVTTRFPEAARRWSNRGVEVRRGDFNDAANLSEAFAGAERLLIISTSADNALRVEEHRRAIAAARQAGVGHIHYTSIVQRAGSKFLPTKGHLQTEADLAQSGLRSTILRNGQYMENLPMFLRIGMDGDTIALPPDGPTAWVALDDLAEGIARILAAPDGEEREPARALTLTGPEAVDFLFIAGLLSRILGRPIGRKNISDQEFIRRAVEAGMSAVLAQVLASGFRSRAAGELT
jgi:NAD(P)H dehydrogenase (quinone)